MRVDHLKIPSFIGDGRPSTSHGRVYECSRAEDVDSSVKPAVDSLSRSLLVRSAMLHLPKLAAGVRCEVYDGRMVNSVAEAAPRSTRWQSQQLPPNPSWRQTRPLLLGFRSCLGPRPRHCRHTPADCKALQSNSSCAPCAQHSAQAFAPCLGGVA